MEPFQTAYYWLQNANAIFIKFEFAKEAPLIVIFFRYGHEKGMIALIGNREKKIFAALSASNLGFLDRSNYSLLLPFTNSCPYRKKMTEGH